MLTFAEAKSDDGLLQVSGACANTSRFTYLVNAATRRLMRRGDWAGTVTPIQVCAKSGCVTFPRYVGHVRKINLCHRELPVGNLWYQFINRREWGCGSWKGHMRGECVLFANGISPTYSDVWGDGRLIRAYPRCRADIGKTVRIFGVDNGNQPLKTDNGDGTWSDGIVITLADPFGSTSLYVRRIDRVVKDETQCQVFLYGYNATANTLEDLAIYDPGEISPSYQRYRLSGHHHGGCSNIGGTSPSCSKTLSIVALVKLQFIPVKFDTDLVLIDNLDALKLEIQSIRAGEAGDRDMAKALEVDAVAESNRELEDSFPDDTFSAVNNVFAGRSFSNQSF